MFFPFELIVSDHPTPANIAGHLYMCRKNKTNILDKNYIPDHLIQ